MNAKIFLTILLLINTAATGAQNASAQESSGILSSLPDIQINSAENYNASVNQSSESQPNLSWIIVLGLIFMGVILYSFNIDPKWVILLIGVTALVFLLSRLGLIPV